MPSLDPRFEALRDAWSRLRRSGLPLAAAVAASVLVLAASACSSGDLATGPGSDDGADDPGSPTVGTGTLSVSLTDAPDTLLAAAVVHIGRVEAVPADDEEDDGDEEDSAPADSAASDSTTADSADAAALGRVAAQQGDDGEGDEGDGDEGDGDEEDGEGGPVVIVEEGGAFDLLELRDGITELLGSAEVDVGTYAQLRFIVDSARVELKEGLTFRDGSTSRELMVPSGAQTGIKLNLDRADGDASDGGTEVEEGEETSLIVDFDVSQSFVVQGNPNTPAGIRGFLFTPVLRVAEEDAAGSVAGTVSGPEGADVEGLTVTAEPAGDGAEAARIAFQQQQEEGGQTETATAATDAEGAYELSGLAPGGYTVSVEPPEGFEADPASREVEVGEGESVEGVDFTLVEASSGG